MSYLRIILLFLISFLINGCFSTGSFYSPSSSTNVKIRNSASMHKATMRPYVVNGKKYYPTVVNVGDRYSGIASWYGPNFHGKKTSNGEIYNMHNMTAAHKTLPMNTILKVINLHNNKSVVVRINDRGPFVANRIIDLSKAAASKIDMLGSGTAPVAVEVLEFKHIGIYQNKSSQPKSIDIYGANNSNKVIVGGDFMVQIGSFLNKTGAHKYAKMNSYVNGYTSVVENFLVNGRLIHRVFLTGFKSEEEAYDFARSGKFIGAYIIRR